MLYVMNDKLVTKQINGFMNFIRQQGVVGLAVGLVLGTSIKSFVDSIVNNLVNPVIGYFIGGVDLSDKSICLTKSTDSLEVCRNSLAYGQVITNLISFIIIAAIVYFFVKGLKLDKLDIPVDKK